MPRVGVSGRMQLPSFSIIIMFSSPHGAMLGRVVAQICAPYLLPASIMARTHSGLASSVTTPGASR